MKRRSSDKSLVSHPLDTGTPTRQIHRLWHHSTPSRTNWLSPRHIFGSFCTILLSSLLLSLFVVINPVIAQNATKPATGQTSYKPSLQQVINEANAAKCVEYPPIVKEIANEEIRKYYAQQKGEEYKPQDKTAPEKCLNICDLCKERPIPPPEQPPPPPKSLCLGDPPMVVQYLPYTTRKITTSVYATTPTGGPDIVSKLPINIGSHAELQNKIMRADLPQDVIAKLLATYLYDQDDVTLNNSLQNLAQFSPFENQEPPKPVGFSTKVAIMMYVNKYYECNENPADLRDLKY